MELILNGHLLHSYYARIQVENCKYLSYIKKVFLGGISYEKKDISLPFHDVFTYSVCL